MTKCGVFASTVVVPVRIVALVPCVPCRVVLLVRAAGRLFYHGEYRNLGEVRIIRKLLAIRVSAKKASTDDLLDAARVFDDDGNVLEDQHPAAVVKYCEEHPEVFEGALLDEIVEVSYEIVTSEISRGGSWKTMVDGYIVDISENRLVASVIHEEWKRRVADNIPNIWDLQNDQDVVWKLETQVFPPYPLENRRVLAY